eukprot:TRINITY_DN7597_c0_g1_i1.p1 TRINITY_DN7597_c0_g1~~TRINITY_DN7597_c0_g1_i1.p1  ORF type:complete len:1364 (+),score=359.96 TRINITY_DN7597_c0_g1_i1:366-4094(+)
MPARPVLSAKSPKKRRYVLGISSAVVLWAGALAGLEAAVQDDGWELRSASYGVMLAATAGLLIATAARSAPRLQDITAAALVVTPALVCVDAGGVMAWPLLLAVSQALIAMRNSRAYFAPPACAAVWVVLRSYGDAEDRLGAEWRRSDTVLRAVSSALSSLMAIALLLPLPLTALQSGRSLRAGVRLAHAIAEAMVDFDLDRAEQLLLSVNESDGPLRELAVSLGMVMQSLRLYEPYLPDGIRPANFSEEVESDGEDPPIGELLDDPEPPETFWHHVEEVETPFDRENGLEFGRLPTQPCTTLSQLPSIVSGGASMSAAGELPQPSSNFGRSSRSSGGASSIMPTSPGTGGGGQRKRAASGLMPRPADDLSADKKRRRSLTTVTPPSTTESGNTATLGSSGNTRGTLPRRRPRRPIVSVDLDMPGPDADDDRISSMGLGPRGVSLPSRDNRVMTRTTSDHTALTPFTLNNVDGIITTSRTFGGAGSGSCADDGGTVEDIRMLSVSLPNQLVPLQAASAAVPVPPAANRVPDLDLSPGRLSPPLRFAPLVTLQKDPGATLRTPSDQSSLGLDRSMREMRQLRRQRQLDASVRCRSAATMSCEASLAAASQSPRGHAADRRRFDASQRLISGALESIWRDGGDVLDMRADGLFAAWNSHRPCGRYALAACRASFVIAGGQWTAAATAGRLLCGYCGIPGRRMTPFVAGAAAVQARHLTALTSKLGVPVLVTDNVREQVALHFECLAVDAVPSVPSMSSTPPCLVYWLRGPFTEDDDRVRLEREKHTSAFISFINHRFQEAKALWTEGGLHHGSRTDITLDQQRKRLVKLCEAASGEAAAALNLPQPYTRPLCVWKDYEGIARSVLHASPSPSPAASVADKPLATPRSSGRAHGARFEELAFDAASVRSDAGALRQHIELAISPRQAERNWSSSGSDRSGADSDQEMLPSHFADVSGGQYWRSGKQLGKGAAGEVWLGMGDHGGLVALKYLKLPQSPMKPSSPLRPRAGDKSTAAVDQLVTEVRVLSHLRHDNIVGYLGSCVDHGWAIIAMECVSGGSLQQLMENFKTTRQGGGLPEASSRRYIKDMLRGLQFLHAKGVVHRDFKPGNVLLTIDGLAKLADFGESAVLTTLGRCGAVVGTPLFMAPEAASGAGAKPSDVWGFGLTVLQMVTGSSARKAFDVPGADPDAPIDMNFFMRWLAKTPDAVPTIPAELSEATRDFISSCVRRDPADRPAVDELLLHRFLC